MSCRHSIAFQSVEANVLIQKGDSKLVLDSRVNIISEL